MPIYEFRCADCGNIQEVLVSSSSKEKEIEMKCQACEGETLERVLSCVSYAMGSSASGGGPSATSKSCGPGKSCSMLNLPGHSR